jgi:hypothetical protein
LLADLAAQSGVFLLIGERVGKSILLKQLACELRKIEIPVIICRGTEPNFSTLARELRGTHRSHDTESGPRAVAPAVLLVDDADLATERALTALQHVLFESDASHGERAENWLRVLLAGRPRLSVWLQLPGFERLRQCIRAERRLDRASDDEAAAVARHGPSMHRADRGVLFGSEVFEEIARRSSGPANIRFTSEQAVGLAAIHDSKLTNEHIEQAAGILSPGLRQSDEPAIERIEGTRESAPIRGAVRALGADRVGASPETAALVEKISAVSVRILMAPIVLALRLGSAAVHALASVAFYIIALIAAALAQLAAAGRRVGGALARVGVVLVTFPCRLATVAANELTIASRQVGSAVISTPRRLALLGRTSAAASAHGLWALFAFATHLGGSIVNGLRMTASQLGRGAAAAIGLAPHPCSHRVWGPAPVALAFLIASCAAIVPVVTTWREWLVEKSSVRLANAPDGLQISELFHRGSKNTRGDQGRQPTDTTPTQFAEQYAANLAATNVAQDHAARSGSHAPQPVERSERVDLRIADPEGTIATPPAPILAGEASKSGATAHLDSYSQRSAAESEDSAPLELPLATSSDQPSSDADQTVALLSESYPESYRDPAEREAISGSASKFLQVSPEVSFPSHEEHSELQAAQAGTAAAGREQLPATDPTVAILLEAHLRSGDEAFGPAGGRDATSLSMVGGKSAQDGSEGSEHLRPSAAAPPVPPPGEPARSGAERVLSQSASGSKNAQTHGPVERVSRTPPIPKAKPPAPADVARSEPPSERLASGDRPHIVVASASSAAPRESSSEAVPTNRDPALTCVPYRSGVTSEGKSAIVTGLACRDGDGKWWLMSQSLE